MAVLGMPDADLYDWAGSDDDGEGDALVDAARPGYRQVADVLREDIRSGKYAPGTAIPGQQLLARELKADVAVVNRAVGQLAREGIVASTGHGRPTIVLEQRRWRASVTVPWAGGPRGVTPEVLDAAVSSLSSMGDPAVSGVQAEYVAVPDAPQRPGYTALAVAMTVTAPDVAFAVGRAWAVVSGALRGADGWDLDRPGADAWPAES